LDHSLPRRTGIRDGAGEVINGGVEAVRNRHRPTSTVATRALSFVSDLIVPNFQ
jgi:hypothetical protein